MEKEVPKYGFIAPTITEDNYVLGASNALPKMILQADGNWEKYLPSTERQNVNTETYNCTSFGTLNAFETLFKKVYGENINFSDRFLGINAGTKPPGNDPHTVAEAARKEGVILEQLLPFNGATWQQYYSFMGANEGDCRVKGQLFLNKYVLGHEYVFKDNTPKDKKIALMREALKYSPLCIAVYAWEENEKGEYVRAGDPNHWTLAYKIDDEGRVYVFDSYPPYYKILSVDHDIMYCKRYSLDLNTAPAKDPYVTILQGIVETLKAILKQLYAKSLGKIF